MIYILFFGLCCMFVTAYLMNQKDILSPWVITIGMFLVSTFFAILNIDMAVYAESADCFRDLDRSFCIWRGEY